MTKNQLFGALNSLQFKPGDSVKLHTQTSTFTGIIEQPQHDNITINESTWGRMVIDLAAVIAVQVMKNVHVA